MICDTSRSTNSNKSSAHNVIVQDITISFSCFQLCSNTLCGFHYVVFIIWFLLICVHYLVCPTLFPLFGFHAEQLAAFRLFSRNKSGTRCLASLALPSCVTRATANVRFRKIRKHFVFLKKRRALRLYLKNKSGALPVRICHSRGSIEPSNLYILCTCVGHCCLT